MSNYAHYPSLSKSQMLYCIWDAMTMHIAAEPKPSAGQTFTKISDSCFNAAELASDGCAQDNKQQLRIYPHA